MWGIVGDYWIQERAAAWLLLAALGYLAVLSVLLAVEEIGRAHV